MGDVSIIGIGQIAVGEYWDKSVRALAVDAVLAALCDAHVDQVDALYVGNMLSGKLNGQEHLGALIASELGWHGIEALKIEAACSSGAAAVRAGYLAIVSGQCNRVVVVGVEKMTDLSPRAVTGALTSAGDADYEAANGISFVALNALLMRRYMHEFDLMEEDFACFPVNAHAHAAHNPYAMFRRPITPDQYRKAKPVADPINVFDSAPVCDGAAAVILSRSNMLNGNRARAVKIAASAVATDAISLHSRQDPLWLTAVERSTHKAYTLAGIAPEDIDLFELHDAFAILPPMSLEAAGFAPRGTGVYFARDGAIDLQGKIPISTMGGLKARGHPVGATGVYQIAECVEQLRGEAGSNQVPNARVGMAQSLGGVAATAVTHILTKD
jgi:acetyl-CoA C-acetyltransferase